MVVVAFGGGVFWWCVLVCGGDHCGLISHWRRVRHDYHATSGNKTSSVSYMCK